MDDEQLALRQMVDELCEIDEGLTGWEVTFVDDMSKLQGQYNDDQAEKIRQIHRDRT